MSKPFRLHSSTSLGTAVVFTFFLAASAPHRVHHFFEQISFPTDTVEHSHDAEHSAHHDHAPSHKHRSQPKPINCPVYSATQHSQLSTVQAVQITFIRTFITGCIDHPVVRLSTSNPSPFNQRAPPQA
jgi:hypothetical protein